MELLCATGVGAGLGAMLIVGGAVGIASQLISPAIGQIFGGAGSIANGWGAISTGFSLLTLGPWGIVAGIALMAVGAATMAVGANDIVAGVTGTNYIQQWTGMSDSAYGWMNFGLNAASSLGTLGGNMWKAHIRANALNGIESASYGPKASAHIGERSYYDSVLTQKQVIQYGKIYKAKYGVSGYEFRIAGSTVMGNGGWQSVTTAGLSSTHKAGVWSLVYGKGTIWHWGGW